MSVVSFLPTPTHRTLPEGRDLTVLLLPKCLKQSGSWDPPNFCGIKKQMETIGISTSHGYCEASVSWRTSCAALNARVNSTILTSDDDIDFIRVKSPCKVLQCPIIGWLSHSANYKSFPSLLTEAGVCGLLEGRIHISFAIPNLHVDP